MMMLAEAAGIVQGQLIGDDVRFSSVVTDSRTVKKGGLFVAVSGDKRDGHEYVSDAETRGAAGAMVSKTVQSDLPRVDVADTTLALGRLGRDWRNRFNVPVAAVTGSNGKTTVTAMTASIYNQCGRCLAPEKSFNNQWGVPLTLLRLTDAHRYAVIEMGMNHPGEIEYLAGLTRPAIALINNVAPAHLEGFGELAKIAAAKAEIFSGLVESGVAILNADDEFFPDGREAVRRLTPARKLKTFAIDAEADVRAVDIRRSADGMNFKLCVSSRSVDINLPVPGRHNVMNALAASTIAAASDIGLEMIKAGLEKADGVDARLEMKPGLCGSTIIDDSYNANPQSIKAGIDVLRHYEGRKILVLGAMAELGTASPGLHEDVGRYAGQNDIDLVYCLAPNEESHARFYAMGFGEGAVVFNDIDSLVLKIKNVLGEKVAVLVKGSRSSAMENVVKRLVKTDPDSETGGAKPC